MSKKKINAYEEDNIYLDKYNDQYKEIMDSLDIEESTDSETTDIRDFRVINSNNAYPQKDHSNHLGVVNNKNSFK